MFRHSLNFVLFFAHIESWIRLFLTNFTTIAYFIGGTSSEQFGIGPGVRPSDGPSSARTAT
jgi:hypothetical protein